MSKSKGNVVDPAQLIDGGPQKNKGLVVGVDGVRLWVASSDFTKEVGLGQAAVGVFSFILHHCPSINQTCREGSRLHAQDPKHTQVYIGNTRT